MKHRARRTRRNPSGMTTATLCLGVAAIAVVALIMQKKANDKTVSYLQNVVHNAS